MIIYCAENKKTQKKYIGKTTVPLKKRIRTHELNAFRHNEKTVFYDALRSYGIENFKWYILEKITNEKTLNDRERYWIKEHRTHYKEGGKGYNMTHGGDGGKTYDQTGRKLSEDSKEKIKDSLREYYNSNEAWNKGKTYKEDSRIKRIKGKKNGMFGKTQTDEAKEKIRQANLGRKPWNTGKTISKETKEKIRNKMKGRYVSDETNIKKVLSRNGITLKQLLEIRDEVLKEKKVSEETIIHLSEKYNVPRTMIKNIKTSRIWCLIENLKFIEENTDED